MKKTLIALAVAASAAVSGSAMAWTANGTGGSVDLGGTLTPVEKVTPWEVKVGAAVNDLAGVIKQGSTIADVQVNTTIPVLGIRTVSNSGFVGGEGLNPQISYGNAVDFAASENGVAPVTLTVKNADDQSEIGKLTTSMDVVARIAWKNADGSNSQNFNVYATDAGQTFYGGVGGSSAAVSSSASVSDANTLFSGVTDNYTDFGGEDIGVWGENTVDNAHITYSGVYASAVKAGSVIKLTLNSPADVDAINWTAQLPVTVSYQ
ncbi:fimbrial protein [Escherichia coli]|uniref:F4 family fimbrial subunit n=1 Tax=Escherichia coli TaxID=562 RepID=UPI000CFD1F20|nr:fimbrial protein [Escherichia coli]